MNPDHVAVRAPRLVWVLCAMFGLLGVAYSVLVPLLHGPDEGAHVDRIASSWEPEPTDPPGQQDNYSPDLLVALAQVDIVAVDHRVAPVIPWTGLGPPPLDDPTAESKWDELAPPGSTDKVNPAMTGPPGYYALVGTVDRTADLVGVDGLASAPWRRAVANWRLQSALLLLPLPWLTFAATRRIGGSRGAATTAAALALAVPQLSHSAGSVNNDALLLLALWVCALACLQLATGDLRSRVALLAGASAGIGMLAKVFALGAPLWILAAILAGARGVATPGAHDGPGLVARAGRPLAIAAAACVAFGGWWPVGQLLAHGTPAPRGFNYPQPGDVQTSLATWLREAVERLSSTGFGRFGIEQFGIPGPLVVLATVGLLVVGVLGARRLARQRGPALASVVLLPAVTTLVLVATAAWGGYVRSGLPTGLHGRYLFVAAPGILALAGIGVDGLLPARSARTWSRGVGLALAAAVVLQSAGLWTVTRSYWAGTLRDQVRTAMLASGHGDAFFAVIALLAVATVVVAVVTLRDAATSRADDRAPVST